MLSYVELPPLSTLNSQLSTLNYFHSQLSTLNSQLSTISTLNYFHSQLLPYASFQPANHPGNLFRVEIKSSSILFGNEFLPLGDV